MDVRTLPFVSRIPGIGVASGTTVVEIDLALGVAAHTAQDPLSAWRQRQTPSLDQITRGLRRAAEPDSRVGAVVVYLADGIDPVIAEEIGVAIETVNAAGVPTTAVATSFGEGGSGTISYGLAARCEQIWLQPTGQVSLTGLAATMTTLGGALRRVGIEPEFSQRHEYKTAGEQFSASEISPANREMTGRLAASVTENVLAVVARRRGLAEPELRDIVDRSPLSAEQALEAGLVDHLGYRDQADEAIDAAVGGSDQGDDATDRVFAHRFERRGATPDPVALLRRRSAPRIAVVDVMGPITTGRGRSSGPFGGPTSGSDSVVAALRSARTDQRVRAVIVRVDSPGGSAVASDAIRREVLRVREAGLPVIASMGYVAASGGYFVAMPADHIVASPSTITGSIGVVGGKFVTREALQRWGVARESIGSGANSTMFASDRPFTPEQRTRFEAWLDEIYADFTAKAAADRGLTAEQIDAAARGRVWTGADALDLGLVDNLGGHEAAIALACERIHQSREDVEITPWPSVSWVARLRPAESTRSAAALQHAATTAPGARGLSGWVEALETALTTEFSARPGDLMLPWHLSLH